MSSHATNLINQHVVFDHLLKIHLLDWLSKCPDLSPAVHAEATAELYRYRVDGITIHKHKEPPMPKRKRGDKDPKTFTGRGIVFAVIDDREDLRTGRVTTIDVIAEAIELALDAGHETSEEIARYLTTSAFQHEPDKRVRFNSLLKAGDVVGAQMTRKLYNSYNELAKMADDEKDDKKREAIRNEATGFAEALSIVMSPFSCEDPKDPRLVNWDEVDRITAAFEKEQRFVRKERGGNPQ